jgi:hypothetical protein
LPVKKNSYRRRGETATIAGWGPRGEPPFSHRNGVWRVALGAHPKLGALVGALLELRFLPRHIYLAMGAQVGALLELLFACMTSVPKFANCFNKEVDVFCKLLLALGRSLETKAVTLSNSFHSIQS